MTICPATSLAGCNHALQTKLSLRADRARTQEAGEKRRKAEAPPRKVRGGRPGYPLRNRRRNPTVGKLTSFRCRAETRRHRAGLIPGALAGFRSGQVRGLAATDIASRGIDVEAVSHVINFEMPNARRLRAWHQTARVGATGIAISFCGDDERPYRCDIEKLTRRRLRSRGCQRICRRWNTPRGRKGAPSTRGRKRSRHRGSACPLGPAQAATAKAGDRPEPRAG